MNGNQGKGAVDDGQSKADLEDCKIQVEGVELSPVKIASEPLTESTRLGIDAVKMSQSHDISMADMIFTRSDSIVSTTADFDPENVEEDATCGDLAKDNYRKYTAWFGIRFKSLHTELKFLNEHAVLNRSTVYGGYAFQIICGILQGIFGLLMKTYNTSICDNVSDSFTDNCLDIISPGGPEAERKLSIITFSFLVCINLTGMLLQWLIHRSPKIKNKAIALAVIWMIYAIDIICMSLIYALLDTENNFWALRMFLMYTYNFLIAVWFTGLIFSQSCFLFVVTGVAFYAITIPRGLHDIGMTSQALPIEMMNSYIMGYLIYLAIVPQIIIYSAIALVTSYLNERTARMRFLERLMVVHQQNNVIHQKTRNEKMQRAFLENMLPPSIVDQLQMASFSVQSFERLSQRHQGVSILFADIAGFTSFATKVDSATVMHFLNELFLQFDELCDQYNVYKVETVGDCYVAAVGVVTGQIISTNMEHSQTQSSELAKAIESAAISNTKDMVGFAKEMLSISRSVMKPKAGSPALMRVGIHTGPCMSGIVGTRNLRYCLFGDTMNTAARMEQNGVVDAIHVSSNVAKLTPDQPWEDRGSVSMKGKGSMDTFLLQVK